MPLCYLGFQKAPPTSVVAGSSLRVAPIICNDLRDDICVDAIWNATEEGQKVIRNKGSKWFAAFRRIRDSENEESIE